MSFSHNPSIKEHVTGSPFSHTYKGVKHGNNLILHCTSHVQSFEEKRGQKATAALWQKAQSLSLRGRRLRVSRESRVVLVTVAWVCLDSGT